MQAKKIDRAEFERMLMDPETPDAALRPYLRLDPLAGDRFRPVVVPNPDLVDFGGEGGGGLTQEAAGAVSILNNVARWRRRKRYERRIREGWSGVRVVAEGDSWFQYPLLLDDVITHLSRDWAICCLSAAGDLLQDMARQDEVVAAVISERPDFLLLSGGGNDVLGGGALQQRLRSFTAGLAAEDYAADGFTSLLGSSMTLYGDLMERALSAGAKKIICHSYDYAIPDHGRWLGRPMGVIGISDPPLQRAIIRDLIDRFHAALTQTAARFGGLVVVADTRGSVPDDAWHDELHPDSRGYAFPAAVIRAAAEGRALPPRAHVEAPASDAPPPPLVIREAAAFGLMAAGEAALIEEIGRRQAVLEVSPGAAGGFSPEAPVPLGAAGLSERFREIGLRLVARLERELFGLLCGAEPGQAKDRERLRESLQMSDATLLGGISSALIGLSCPPFLAPLAAAVILKRGVDPVWERTCALWSERLGPSSPNAP